MNDAIVFNGSNSLDFTDIRSQVIRIPEVCARIHEAQKVWDSLDEVSFNFNNYLMSEDKTYLSQPKMRNLSSAIVQVGLFDRYVKRFHRPQYVFGNLNGDSALLVCAGQSSFEDMILRSKAAQSNLPTAHLFLAAEPLLAGESLANYGLYALDEIPKAENSLKTNMGSLENLVNHLVNDLSVRKIINIGPGQNLVEKFQQKLALTEVQFHESIDVDPMLSWFWTGVRKSEYMMVAQ